MGWRQAGWDLGMNAAAKIWAASAKIWAASKVREKAHHQGRDEAVSEYRPPSSHSCLELSH